MTIKMPYIVKPGNDDKKAEAFIAAASARGAAPAEAKDDSTGKAVVNMRFDARLPGSMPPPSGRESAGRHGSTLQLPRRLKATCPHQRRRRSCIEQAVQMVRVDRWWPIELVRAELAKEHVDLDAVAEKEQKLAVKVAPEHVGGGHRSDNVTPNRGTSSTYILARLDAPSVETPESIGSPVSVPFWSSVS
jgi:hypothetical protein